MPDRDPWPFVFLPGSCSFHWRLFEAEGVWLLERNLTINRRARGPRPRVG